MSIDARGTEPGEAGASAAAGSSASAVDREILDSLTGLVKHVGVAAHAVVSGLGIAPHDLLAMFKLDEPLSMKEMAHRMGCDASFVTAVADTLEGRGFVRREASQRDRRVKNLVLTPEGCVVKERLLAELAARMPWSYALDAGERQCFLRLLRKMSDAPTAAAAGSAGGPAAGSAGADEGERRTRSR
jgi:MarR family transcriptional regulator, organic hydroperoxide resistance regulator